MSKLKQTLFSLKDADKRTIEETLKEKDEEINQLKQELAELKEKDNYHLRYELAGADETITNLKQQLEEKDKEIEELKLKLDIRAMSLQNINTERMESEQNQTQLAIKELEKVREWLEPKYFDYEQINYLTRIIDNQIKELKGE